MDELAYRIRAAEPEDLKGLSAVKVSVARPDGRGRSDGLRTAQQRGELLVLERSDRSEGGWAIVGFIEWHMRVDDTLTLRDVGSAGDAPHAGIVKHLIGELLLQLAPQAATCVVRRDAQVWNEILASIPGWFVEGPPEYRRPHYYNIWRWSPELAREAERQSRRDAPRGRRAPDPPRPRPATAGGPSSGGRTGGGRPSGSQPGNRRHGGGPPGRGR